jgi:hypothetical protein
MFGNERGAKNVWQRTWCKKIGNGRGCEDVLFASNFQRASSILSIYFVIIYLSLGENLRL